MNLSTGCKKDPDSVMTSRRTIEKYEIRSPEVSGTPAIRHFRSSIQREKVQSKSFVCHFSRTRTEERSAVHPLLETYEKSPLQSPLTHLDRIILRTRVLPGALQRPTNGRKTHHSPYQPDGVLCRALQISSSSSSSSSSCTQSAPRSAPRGIRPHTRISPVGS